MPDKPKLILTPQADPLAQLEQHFLEGKPLSAAERDYIFWHSPQLSNTRFDSLLRYYLHRKSIGSFLLPTLEINEALIKQLKRRLKYMLDHLHHGVEVHMTPEQFQAFRLIIDNELIYYHGNQSLTGAPYFSGGLPHIIYFQWGNYLGVVKYQILPGEKYLKANLLIYFEDLEERLLNQAVKDYEKEHALTLRQDLARTAPIATQAKAEPISQAALNLPNFLKLRPSPRLR